MISAAAPTRRSTGGRLGLVAVAIVLSVGFVSCSGSSSDTTASTTTTTASSTTTEALPPTPLPPDRPIEVHVPPGYEKGTPAPLLIMLHGFGASGAVQDAYLRLTPAVDERTMLYVYPDGTEDQLGRRFWNATEACCGGPDASVDDSAYLAAVIADVAADYDVDPKRIYVMGHSNGGFMSYRMACDHADVVAAVASLEGATFDDPADCAPSEPVAALQVHGTADETITFEGDEIAGRRYPGAVETVETWAAYNGCGDAPDSPAPPNRDVVADLPPATITRYSDGCDPGGAAELWTQPDGVHIPQWSDSFIGQVLDWLLEHPKP